MLTDIISMSHDLRDNFAFSLINSPCNHVTIPYCLDNDTYFELTHEGNMS